ncbi:MAG: DedA family protein [Intrasporangium sp.]|uniref:DedA family protein n=1 Tax=Intrasporangium sp. TaxID=1925024 RepID=UPI002649F82E|nr:DedA family protein [Intrasporangium sp.]MDN5796987.1 DedA family protein [Intrasporangium sp.]
MSSFLDSLFRDILGLPALLIYLVVGLLVFLEDAIFIGFVLPGETAAVLGGVAASLGHVDLPVILGVIIAAAILGDSVGFEIGRHLGPGVLGLRPLVRHRERLSRAQDLLARRGGVAVFLGRWVAFFRAVMPALAGTSGMHYPTFLAWNAAGGIAWSTTVVSIGYLAGSSYSRVEQWLGRGAAIVIAVVVVVVLVVWRVRRHRAEARREGDAAAADATDANDAATDGTDGTTPADQEREGR